uniref:Uncharacterized protein n=1 Tax=Pyrodinium bahamense TaxID=73915 RepID=A0A7S0B8X1_9DINO
MDIVPGLDEKVARIPTEAKAPRPLNTRPGGRGPPLLADPLPVQREVPLPAPPPPPAGRQPGPQQVAALPESGHPPFAEPVPVRRELGPPPLLSPGGQTPGPQQPAATLDAGASSRGGHTPGRQLPGIGLFPQDGSPACGAAPRANDFTPHSTHSQAYAQPPGPWPLTAGPTCGRAVGHGLSRGWGHGDDSAKRHYVVMCKDDVEVRASPTYADDTRIGHFLHPGQVVVTDDRRMVQGSWFLHLADGRGWVFETKDRLLVMTEAHGFERGLWHYSIVCDSDVETRITPTYSDDARTGLVLGPGDCIAVDERCSVAGARFLKLADGRGWVFETKDRLVVMSEVRAHVQEARDFARGLWHYSVVCDDNVEIRAAPTYSDEARTGLTIHPGDCVPIDERCRVGAAWFLRLADGRGWVFETKDSRHVMAQLR